MIWCPVVTAQVAITRHVVGLPFSAAEDAANRPSLRAHADAGRGLRAAPRTPGLGVRDEPRLRRRSACSVSDRSTRSTAARAPVAARPRRGAVCADVGEVLARALGLYGRDGLRPLVPELVLLPQPVPVHPMRFYCHTRYVYLAMAFLQGCAREVRSRPSRRRAAPRTLRPVRAARSRSASTATTSRKRTPSSRRVCWFAPRSASSAGTTASPSAGCAKRPSTAARTLIAARPDRDRPPHALAGERRAERARRVRARGADPAEVARCVAGFEFYRFEDDARGLRYAAGARASGTPASRWKRSRELGRGARAPRRARGAYRFLAAHQMTRSVAGATRCFRTRPKAGGVWATRLTRGR